VFLHSQFGCTHSRLIVLGLVMANRAHRDAILHSCLGLRLYVTASTTSTAAWRCGHAMHAQTNPIVLDNPAEVLQELRYLPLPLQALVNA
jgi:hypothetical protein